MVHIGTKSVDDMYRVNEEISEGQVRIVFDGEAPRILPLKEAIALAVEQNLDLVQIAAGSPPVCKILDYQKFRYQKQRQMKNAVKKQRANEMEEKEVRFSPRIGSGDLDFKTEQIRSFLAKGCTVKVSVRFRGREMSHADIGHNLLFEVTAKLGEQVRVVQPPKLSGMLLTTVLAPK